MAALLDKSDETNRRLLDAALQIFAERGFEAATTRQICARARANPAAVNYHFGDKLGLYKAVLQDVVTVQRSRMAEQDLAGMEPEAGLREFIRRMVAALSVQPTDPYQRLMVNEMAQPTAGLPVMVECIMRPRSQLLCALVSQIIGSTPKSWQTRFAVYSVISQIVHFMHARPVIQLLWPDWRSDPAMTRRLAAHIEEFSLNALRQMAFPLRKTPRAARSRSG